MKLNDLKATPQLREAYNGLLPATKQQLLHRAAKEAPEIIECLMERAGLDKGGFRIERLRKFYKALDGRIDHAITDPRRDKDTLPALAFIFLLSVRQQWLVAVRQAWDAVPAEAKGQAVGNT